MLISKIIFDGLSNFSHIAYLLKSRHSVTIKARLIGYWLKIHFKFIASLFFTIKRENIFGYTIDLYNYTDFRLLFEEIFYKNEYYFKSTNKTPVIFDCGANIGVATLYFKWLYPHSKIFAFEPNPKTFEVLQKNIQQNNLTDVELFNYALTNTNNTIGTIDFFIDKHNPGFLLMSTKQNRIPKDKTVDKITVKTLSLSSLIKDRKFHQIDFLKMDIEGREEEVVNDLVKNRQLTMIEKLAIEYHHNMDRGHSPSLSKFLQVFEKNGFDYQLDARCIPTYIDYKFQDVLIFLHKQN